MVALLGFAVATYPGLPGEIPVHLDASGDPTRFEVTTPMSWFALSGITLLTFGALQVVSMMLPKRPHLFNFPDKDRFLALPAEYRSPVIVEMQVVLEVCTILTLLTLWMVQLLMWRKAMGADAGLLEVAPFLGFLVAPVVLALMTRVSSATEREERRWKARVDAGQRAKPVTRRRGALPE